MGRVVGSGSVLVSEHRSTKTGVQNNMTKRLITYSKPRVTAIYSTSLILRTILKVWLPGNQNFSLPRVEQWRASAAQGGPNQ